MSDFNKLDKEILARFHEGKLDLCISSIKELLWACTEDPDDFGFKIKKHFDRLEFNLIQVYNTLYYKEYDNAALFDQKVSANTKPHNLSDKDNILYIPGKDKNGELKESTAITVTNENKDLKPDTQILSDLHKQADESKYRLERKILILTNNQEQVLPSCAANMHQIILHNIVNLLKSEFQVDVQTYKCKGTIYNLPFNNPRYVEHSDLRDKYDYIVLFNHINIGSYIERLKVNDSNDPRFIGVYTNDIYELKPGDQLVARMKRCVFLTENHRDILVNKVPALATVKYDYFYMISQTFTEANIGPITKNNKIIKTCVYLGPTDKSLDLVLAIWPFIHKLYNDCKLEILLAGNRKIKDDKKLNITVHQLQNDRQRLMLFKRCGIIIHPCISRDTVFSEPLIQAQAAGCVPVTFNLRNVDQQIAPEVNMIDAKTATELITGIEAMILNIKQLIGNPTDYHNISGKCAKFGQSKTEINHEIFSNIFDLKCT
jgi:hypothetical protein